LSLVRRAREKTLRRNDLLAVSGHEISFVFSAGFAAFLPILWMVSAF
jgi:hypothetical protein